MTPGDLLILLAMALVFVPLERVLPARPHRWSWPRMRVDLLHLFVSGTVIKFAGGAVILGMMVVAARLTPGAVRAAVQAQPEWLQFIEILLLADLGFYAAHRLFHAVPALWRFHEVHHSSEQLDWLAAYRVHPVDQILNSAMILGPVILLGFSAGPLIVYAMIYRWHSILLHSNVRVDFGPLRWIVASPLFHHWHHADQPDAYDRNFGGQLVIFDWLFGTLNLGSRKLPERYGLSPPIPAGYLAQLTHPLRPARGEPALSPSPEHA